MNHEEEWPCPVHEFHNKNCARCKEEAEVITMEMKNTNQ